MKIKTKLHKITAFFLAFVMILSISPIITQASAPFEVRTIADLKKVGTGIDGWTLSAHYIQMADIDMAGVEFTPIGLGNSFDGTYDGNNFTISNLIINYIAGQDTGLFARIGFSGMVKNIGMVGGAIDVVGSGGFYVGSLAGFNSGTIINCYFTGNSITNANDDIAVGGLVGNNFDTGIIDNCHVTGNISNLGVPGSRIGGLVGLNNGMIVNSYAIGNVNDESSADLSSSSKNYYGVGGLVGLNIGTIEYCYTTGDITGTRRVGGVAGVNTGTIEYCHTTGNIIRVNAKDYESNAFISDSFCVGGMAGENYGAIENCYTTGNVSDLSGFGKVGGVVGNNEGSIVYCYTTGDISGSEGVGGVAGWNNSLNGIGTIKNCYATGIISGKNGIGGIVGDNRRSTVSNCVALNYSVEGILGVGRIAGFSFDAEFNDNYARSELTPTFTGMNHWLPEIGANRPDGASVYSGTNADQYNNQAFWIGLGWDFTNAWTISGNNLPVLIESNAIPRVSDPLANHDSGVAIIGTIIELSSSTLDAIIRYTTDGTTPTLGNGYVYSDLTPIIITETLTIITAKAFKNGMSPSRSVVFRYEMIPPPVAPVITTNEFLPDASVGELYTKNLGITGTYPVTWSLISGTLPSGLNLSADGIISGIPTDSGISIFTIKVENRAGEDTKSFRMVTYLHDPNVMPPVITSSSPLVGTIGSQINYELTAESQTHITWEYVEGNLPNGLVFADGAIRGTPTQTGYGFYIVVRATNSVGNISAIIQINIREIVVLPQIITTSLPMGIIGVQYNETIDEVTGSPYLLWNIEKGNLPDGLMLVRRGEDDKIAIYGVPTKSGTFTFSIRVEETVYGEIVRDTKEFTIIIDGKNVYRVSTKQQLIEALSGGSATVGRYVILEENISATDWKPIYGFQGTLDGDGHCITLTMSVRNKGISIAGLFGLIDAGEVTIKNLAVKSSKIKADADVGKVSISYAGGLIGGVVGGNVVIENCYFNGTVIAESLYSAYSGGETMIEFAVDALSNLLPADAKLVYDLYSTVYKILTGIEEEKGSYAYAGGFIGYIGADADVSITNSHASGRVTSEAGLDVIFDFFGVLIGIIPNYSYAGGLIGYQSTIATRNYGLLSIENCYTDNNIEAYTTTSLYVRNKGSYVGGVIGKTSTFSHAFYSDKNYRLNTKTLKGNTKTDAGVDSVLSLDAMQNKSSFIDWSFTDIWNIDDTPSNRLNSGYPYLRSLEKNYTRAVANYWSTSGYSSTNETPEQLTQVIEKEAGLFADVRVNGILLTLGEHYSVESGFTIVTLFPSFLDTLEEGLHTMTVNFTDGVIIEDQFITREITDIDSTQITSIHVNEDLLVPNIHYDSKTFELYESYLNTLPNGTHALTLNFSDGTTVEEQFEINRVISTYTATINPENHIFPTSLIGYNNVATQVFTITNTGTGKITGLSASFINNVENFEISEALSGNEIEPGETVTISVRPKNGLVAHTYADVLKITGDNGINLEVPLEITVFAKAVSVGAQAGTLMAGTAGTVTFPVTTENIDDGEYDVTVTNRPTGVTIQGKVIIDDNAGTLTLAGNTSTVAGETETLTLTLDGTTSTAFTLEIIAPTTVKSVSVGTQSGTLTAGTAGTVTFPVTTANIANGSYTVTVANRPTGISIQGQVTINNNVGTLTLAGSTSTIASVTNTLTLTLDNITSAAFTITISALSSPVIYGDLNGKGYVDSSDLILMLKYFSQAGMTVDVAAADVNGDGRVDQADLILLLKYFAQPGIVLGPPEEEE